MKMNWIKSLILTAIIFATTAGIFLYTAGYRISRNLDNKNFDVSQTGIISAKSIPEVANVYLNGELKTVTNGTIQGLVPGKHNLRILKNGFVTWEKEVEVFAELVTDITAVLVSQSPRLEPLTNTGARQPTISPSLNKIAFFSKDGSAPGVWVIPLTGDALSLFRSNPYVVLEDTANQIYSNGIAIEWAPDEKELLVEGDNATFQLVDLNTGEVSLVPNVEEIRKTWTEETTKKRLDFIEKLDIPQELRDIAVKTDTLWAPDEKKFLYKVEQNGQIEYRVYNMEKPIPVGEKVESVAFTTVANQPQPEVSWYADSFHLILTETSPETPNRGKISLIRIDGTNKVEVFGNELHSNRVFSSPSGDKLIMLTSFKSGDQTDLYTIGIR